MGRAAVRAHMEENPEVRPQDGNDSEEEYSPRRVVEDGYVEDAEPDVLEDDAGEDGDSTPEEGAGTGEETAEEPGDMDNLKRPHDPQQRIENLPQISHEP